MPSNVKIDGIDVKIIRALQKDARANFSKIAKDCAVSTDTISKRFKRMKRTGIVRRTTILLDPRSLDYTCVASLGIDAEYPHAKEVADFVRKIPGVIFCTPSLGRNSIFAIAVLKDIHRLGQVKEHIEGHPMVREVAASIWVDEIRLCPQNFEFEDLKKK